MMRHHDRNENVADSVIVFLQLLNLDPVKQIRLTKPVHTDD
jgi:hypothetical protein